jgi:hypothetical protein
LLNLPYNQSKLRSIKSRSENFHPKNKKGDYSEKAVITEDLSCSTANRTKAEMLVKKRKET